MSDGEQHEPTAQLRLLPWKKSSIQILFSKFFISFSGFPSFVSRLSQTCWSTHF